MLNKNEFKRLVEERENHENEIMCGDMSYWNNLTDFLSNNIQDTIDFLENGSIDDVVDACEVFDRVAEKTQSREFVAALHRIYDKMPKEVQELIKYDIEFAEQAIED